MTRQELLDEFRDLTARLRPETGAADEVWKRAVRSILFRLCAAILEEKEGILALRVHKSFGGRLIEREEGPPPSAN